MTDLQRDCYERAIFDAEQRIAELEVALRLIASECEPNLCDPRELLHSVEGHALAVLGDTDDEYAWGELAAKLAEKFS